MSAISNNPYDVMNWLTKVADSCKTIEQCDNMCNLIDNYHIQYRGLSSVLYSKSSNLRHSMFCKSLDLIEEKLMKDIEEIDKNIKI